MVIVKSVPSSNLKPEEVNHPFIKKFYRGIGEFIARLLVKANVTPNQVSFFAFFLLVLSGFFFAMGYHVYLIFAALFLQLGYIFDFVDGSLARMKGMSSDYGDWLDHVTGTYGYLTVYLGATLGVYFQIREPYIIFFGLFAIIGTVIKNYTQSLYLNKFNFSKKFGQNMYKKLGFLMFFRATAPLVNTILTLCALFDKMYWALLFLGTYNFLYSIIQNVIFTLKARSLSGKMS